MIPAEAIEAAVLAIGELSTTSVMWEWERYEVARAAIEAAAPHMLAEAWDEAIEAHKALTWDDENMEPLANPYRTTP